MIEYEKLQHEFSEYSKTFLTNNTDADFGIHLKYEHSLFVADYCLHIAQEEALDAEKKTLVHAAGLLHDVARFEQFRRYNTFHDAASVDHGDLGAEILNASRFTGFFTPEELEHLAYATQWHNKRDIPITGDFKEYLTRIVRDADKLDIYRVITECMTEENEATLSHQLSNSTDYSDDIIEDILEGKQVCYTRRKTRNDMRLTILNWVQDLTFHYSFTHIQEKGYLRKVSEHLPDTPRIRLVTDHIFRYIEEKLKTGSTGTQK